MNAARLRGLAERRHDGYLEALQDMVNVDSGSYTVDGVNAIADRCGDRFEAGGWKLERTAHVPREGEP
jgi:hypothetical protein